MWWLLKLTEIVLVVPLETDLEIVVLGDHAEELVHEVGALVFGQAIDVLDVVADGEDGLPAGDGVGADDGVLGGELVADVEWGSTGLSVELEFLVLGCLGEKGLGVCGSESIEELLVGGRESVVDLVTWRTILAVVHKAKTAGFGLTRCPKSVASKSWEIGELQDRVI